MPKKQPNSIEYSEFGEEIMGWEVPEHESYERTKRWYIVAITIALLLLLFSFLTMNFLFAVIIIVVVLIVILRDDQKIEMVKFSITDEGVVIGRRFFDYDEIENFSIVYKPRQEAKNLYFDRSNELFNRIL